MSSRLFVLLAGVLGLWAMGCGIDDVGATGRMVGGRCVASGDCVQRCLTGSKFPGGYCTVGCGADRDCPGGSACVALDGGVCLATCSTSRQCVPFGSGYGCAAVASQWGSPGALACVGR